MDVFKIAGKDLKSILKNKFLIISVIAIIVVPMLYSLLYLDAFWDPYANLEDVPVAVVNQDKGTSLDGKTVNYGDDILNELKENKEIGWKITNEKIAMDGLEGNKYYAVVKIPEDFSKNIVAAKEGSPKTANISFTCNDKKNFLAAQINSKVQSEFKANVTASITSNYVDVAFDSLYKAKDGMKAAADGSTQVKDGLGKLNSQIPTMTTGVDELYKGSKLLTDSQGKLNGGISTLSNGITSLDSGAKVLNGGINQLNDGIGALSSKVPELSNGITTLRDGSKKLQDGYTTKLLPGMGDVKNGLNALNSSLSSGEKSMEELATGIRLIQTKTPEVLGGASGLKAGQSAVADEYVKIIQGTQKLNAGIGQVLAGANTTSTEVEEIGKNINELVKNNPALKDDPNMKAILESLGKLESGKPKVEGGLQQLSQGGKDLETGVNKFNELALKEYFNKTSYFADRVSEYATGSNALAKGTETLLAQVKVGVGKLAAGANTLYNNMVPTNKDGFGYGLAAVSQGTAQLNSKVPELTSGVNQLAMGSKQLKDGSQALVSGAGQVSSGANELQNGSSAILEGQVKLNSGIATLHGSVPELASGVTQLKDGSTELSTKLSDGAMELKNGLVNPSEVMGEFVSNPVALDNTAVNPVPNYGTGFAPYFIPLSLWIGAIMMFFVIPVKVDKEEEDASKFSKVLGKFISFATVGVLQALLVSFIVLGFLGLKPTSVIGFIGTNIFLSLVFVAIVQCLILLLGDAGRLISIVFLILQLTGCGGTFPLEVVPKFFKGINPFMPFTYAVEALREVISATTINGAVLAKDFGILAVIMVIFVIICVIFRDKGERLSEKITAAR